jgi:hypothetical protein
MKKETFVSLIKAIEKHVRVAEQFGKDISNAYVKAGAERDFALSCSYELPISKFIDSIVNAIGNDFADENYKAECAIDFINWWIYETNFGKAELYDYVDGGYASEPAAVVTLANGKEYTVKTPGKLYDVILKDKKLPRKETIHPTINSGKIGDTWGNKTNAND